LFLAFQLESVFEAGNLGIEETDLADLILDLAVQVSHKRFILLANRGQHFVKLLLLLL
jgi:hypothetical protein